MYVAHVVSHTHWDREWYHTAGRFRQRLVALVDELLDDPPAADESFLLDGQAIVLADYLAVRPERRAELAALLATGRLEAGPWYVLADELIPSAEALVRNLLAGRRAVGDLGGEPPPVLYCPDSFGHPAALPELARGFGLDLILLWRGYGGARWPAGDTVRWAAPSGAETLVFHLPPDGYEYGANLPADRPAARERWLRMRDELGRRSATRVLLVPNGADHHARQVGWREAITALAEVAPPDDVRASSLRAFAEHLRAEAAAPLTPLRTITGELRDSYGYTWTLQGTFATRAHEKRANAATERLIERDAEPWAALARRLRGRSRQPLTSAAWRTLLAAHPHDTLCGCSIDAVAHAMEARLADARSQGEGIRDDAILDVLGHDPVRARGLRDQWRPHVVIRNRAPRPRAGVAILEIRDFVADAPVGPGSAAHATPSSGHHRPSSIQGVAAAQVLEEWEDYDRVESPRHYPDNDVVSVARVAAWVDEVPGYGLCTRPLSAPGESHDGGQVPVRCDERSLDNGLVRVEVSDAGAVSISGAAGTRALPDLLWFEDLTDAGDLYTPSPRDVIAVARCTGVHLVHPGPLLGALALSFRLETVKSARRILPVFAHATVQLSLEANAPFVRLRVTGHNYGSDHRLRVGLRTGVRDAEVWADAAFGPVRRPPLAVPESDAARERPPRTAPLHRYVSLFAAAEGATIYSDGMAEYEATADGDVLVTLVRAVGQLSRDDLPERPGHAGWPAATPGAQCHGPFEAELAVFPHGPRTDAEVARIERVADDVLLPLCGDTLRSAIDVPAVVRGVELQGDGLACSAVKDGEDGESVVLRCVNLADTPRDGAWVFGFAIADARLARLDETPLEPLALEPSPAGAVVRFTAGPRAVVTVLAR